MPKGIREVLSILRCPKSHTKLVIDGEKLISETGEEYPIVNGKPVLIKQISLHHVRPPEIDKVSQNITNFNVPAFITDTNALVLHLGSGNVPSFDSRVISLDILPCENADLVAEAEELPFINNTFDYVESGAVFEHLYDPLQAVQEVKRVLKPGGFFLIDTAFMQSYHGYPEHYFNMTPLAIETSLVDDFILEQSIVPDSATPAISVFSLIQRFLSFLPSNEQRRLLKMPLYKVLNKLQSDFTRKNPLLEQFDEYALRSMAASFVVLARKPVEYEAKFGKLYDSGKYEIDKWKALKRKYYAARAELIYQYHLVHLYKRLCVEQGGFDDSQSKEMRNIDEVLTSCIAKDMLDFDVIATSISCLTEETTKVQKIRDFWKLRYEYYLQRNPREIIARIKRKLVRVLKKLISQLHS